ncbi:hypothetical protein EV359DRAFT_83338 [Lentinula novae-zelandiae]|nr:hypothetical protein EV359DRAFT_83338 [Lentinula novae-zelandiae]
MHSTEELNTWFYTSTWQIGLVMLTETRVFYLAKKFFKIHDAGTRLFIFIVSPLERSVGMWAQPQLRLGSAQHGYTLSTQLQ